MDSIYPPSRQQNVSKEIDVREFLMQMNSRLQTSLFKYHDSSLLLSDRTATIFQLMGRNEPGLKQQSHPKLLKAPAEMKEGTGLAPAATSGKKLPLQGSDKLITLQNQEKMMGKNQGYKKRLRTLRKTQLPTFLVDDPVVSQVDTWDKDAVDSWDEEALDSWEDEEDTLTNAERCRSKEEVSISKFFGDVVLTIRVYKEFRQERKSKEKVPAHSQDFLMLGKQQLCELRDLIHCLNDSSCSIGQELPPETLDHIPKIKDLIPAGVFFFGDCFYADQRYGSSQDYGYLIDNWAQSHPTTKMGSYSFQLFIYLFIYYLFIYYSMLSNKACMIKCKNSIYDFIQGWTTSRVVPNYQFHKCLIMICYYYC